MERRLLLEMAKEMGPSEVTRLLCEVVREQAEENYTGLLKERWIRAAQRLEDALHGFGDLREAAAALGRTVVISTEDLCHFFVVRSPGFEGTLAAGEFPAALESFAKIPCRILAGNIPVVRHERDIDWEGNLYEVYQLPCDSTGCLLERHSVSSVWRFRGIGGDLWEVEAPEQWRILNAFEGEQKGLANSQFGRHAPSLWPWWHREPDRDYCVPVGDLREAAAALGRKGGLAKSEAKTIAVRQNGRKGGRPKKTE